MPRCRWRPWPVKTGRVVEEDDEYKLVIGADKNTEAVEILDTTVVDCLEFYDAVANHAELIPHRCLHPRKYLL